MAATDVALKNTIDTLLEPPTINLPQQVTARIADITEQRLRLFRHQENAVQRFYNELSTDILPNSTSATAIYASAHSANTHAHWLATEHFYIASKKPQFIETQKLSIAKNLNARDVAEMGEVFFLFDNLYILDDLVLEVVRAMPPQQPVGWQMTSQGQNLLNVPTLGQIRPPSQPRGLEQSAAATVLQFFGVASYTLDKAVFIGHIVGYLFCCYYFAHLGVAYGVTPINEEVVKDYPFVTLPVPQLVRLLQELDEAIKVNVYQLAVYCAQISEYAIDKRIEKMLISEVNSFNKSEQREALSQRLMQGDSQFPTLFNPIKPLR